MQIRPIMRKIALGTVAVAVTACNEARGPLQKIANQQNITETVNFLNHENKVALKDTAYKLYARDTVQLPCNDLENYLKEFRKDIAYHADEEMPKIVTGSHKGHRYIGSGVFVDNEVLDRTNKFIDPKFIIKNELFTNKEGDLFLPVEFYGKKNSDPKLMEFTE